METTTYITSFIKLQIIKYVPQGIDPLYHVDARKVVEEMVLKIIVSKQELKLSYIKMLIQDYKSILGAKYTLLN
jgi:hypothetical protein